MPTKIGWFFFSGTGKRHFFETDTSLCGRCLLTRNPDKDPGGDNHDQNCTLCREELLKRRTDNAGNSHQQNPGSVPANPQP